MWRAVPVKLLSKLRQSFAGLPVQEPGKREMFDRKCLERAKFKLITVRFR